MGSHEEVLSIRPPIFNGTNFVFWKYMMRAQLQALGYDVWEIVESRYQFPTSIPLDTAGKKQYETMKRF